MERGTVLGIFSVLPLLFFSPGSDCIALRSAWAERYIYPNLR